MLSACPLIGRARELRVLDDLFESVDTVGGSLIVRGEAGVGKSALLEEAVRRAAARGMPVLRTAGVQSEARLPFAGLHQLLRPLLRNVDELPARQRDALRVAFGLADDDPPDVFLIALATLGLLSDSAARTPMLTIAEDAHWLDGPTCDVLAFVARRLEADPILLLISTRAGRDAPFSGAGLSEVVLAGLDDAAARQLLDARAPDLPAPLRERVLDQAAGNPLALVELPIALEQLADGAMPLTWLPLTTRLEQAFATRASGLGTATRALLLVAALNDGDALTETLAAASVLAGEPVDMSDLAPAGAASLLEHDDRRVRFRHPLVRSAIRQAASLSRRQRAHAALADVLAGEPDRRLWHRAAAALGRDEDLADELEAAATRARRLGGIVVAVAALERAAQLSEDPASRGRRLLLAAECAFEMGRHDVVVRLMREAEPLELDPLQRARMAWLRELFEAGIWSGAATVRSFVDIVDRIRLDGDVDLAVRSLLTVALRSWWANVSLRHRRPRRGGRWLRSSGAGTRDGRGSRTAGNADAVPAAAREPHLRPAQHRR